MMKILRPRVFTSSKGRKFTMHTNLLAKPLKGEGSLVNLHKFVGWDRVVLSNLNFFYLTGNVFAAYCLLKGTGWAWSFIERSSNKVYEDQIYEAAAKNSGMQIKKNGRLL